jgi:uncharacterized protein YlzI (FlbEa/FlbD family)
MNAIINVSRCNRTSIVNSHVHERIGNAPNTRVMRASGESRIIVVESDATSSIKLIVH